MKLRDLIEVLDRPVVSGILDTEITSVIYDSRKAGPGAVFVALRGEKVDGHDFIDKALKAGASAIVAETAPPAEGSTPWVHVRDSRFAMGELARVINDDPARQLLVGAITGTNGKTTTAFLLHHLLNHAHLRCGLLGTVVYDVGGELKTPTHTTPEAPELQGLLKQMVDNGCRAVSMEASSHALELHRMSGVKVDAAVFTNLTQDHLDFHGTMEDYFIAKMKLFDMAAANPKGKLIVNTDDVWGRRLVDKFKNHEGLVTYGLGATATYRAVNPRYDLTGTTFELEFKGRSLLARVPLIGQFNVYNSLAAVAAAHALGCNFRDSVKAMQQAPQVPGRMERVTPDNHGFHVFVDYAHTPDGVSNALSSARGLKPQRLITVFGCGGNRDRFKRPLMAKAAEQYSDICILTSDNPRMEDPKAIMQDAQKGFTKSSHALIEDREEAIHTAIKGARPGDIVVIAGKGHEPYQDVMGVKHPFDDRKIAKRLVEREIRIKGEKRLEARELRDQRQGLR
jgi:UDP-N-acetylmuramoyl-L-alanyl-D-glutamate--2,6-diaminopimelate ligase